jgi:peptide/nickel transport system permease protein
MRRYVLRRLLQALIVVWLLTIVVFAIARLSGNPADLMLPQEATQKERAELIHELGLDQSQLTQYWKFISGAVRGDFGESLRFHAPAMDLVLDRMPATIELATTSLLLALVLGLVLGVAAALRHGRAPDYVITGLVTLGQATPSFWLGILLILYFGVHLELLPIAGRSGVDSLIMPAVTLSIVPLVGIARLTRSSVVGVLPQDYVRTARAKGLRRHSVLGRHVLRNALVPVVTLAGISLAELLSGAVITEQIFAWPGIGRLAIESISARDYPVIQAVTLVTATIVVAMNLVIDLFYFLLDPRIRQGVGATA